MTISKQLQVSYQRLFSDRVLEIAQESFRLYPDNRDLRYGDFLAKLFGHCLAFTEEEGVYVSSTMLRLALDTLMPHLKNV